MFVMFPRLSKFVFVYHISSTLSDSRLRYGSISIWSPDVLRMRVILPPHFKFHLNGTTCSWVIAKKWFSMRRPSVILNLRISDFFVVTVACGKICVSMLNFVQFGRFAAEIWKCNDFQNGGRPPCWIFEIWHFHHKTFVCVRLWLGTPNFVLIGQCSRFIAKKMIFNMASVRHLEFGNFWNFLTFPSPETQKRPNYTTPSRHDMTRHDTTCRQLPRNFPTDLSATSLTSPRTCR